MKFELDHRTGMMRPKKDEEIYFAQSQGGGLIVDDKKNNIKYVIQRDGRITKLFGSFDKDNLNLYDMRDARIIADRVRRLLGVDHKYTDFHYFLRGYHMNESVIKKCSDFLGESIWSDIQDRSSGETIRKEDEAFYNMSKFEFLDYLNSKYKDKVVKIEKWGTSKINVQFNSYDTHSKYGCIQMSIEFIEYPYSEENKIKRIIIISSKPNNLLKALKTRFIVKKMYPDNWYYEEGQEKPIWLVINGEKNTVVDIFEFILNNKLNESIWSDIQDRSSGESVRAEDKNVIGVLDDGTKLRVPMEVINGAGELIKFDDDKNYYTLYEGFYLAVVNEDGNDIYYIYDPDSEEDYNMIEIARWNGDSFRTKYEFAQLRAVLQSADEEGDDIEPADLYGLDVTSRNHNSVDVDLSNYDYIIFEDHDSAYNYAVEDTSELESESLESILHIKNPQEQREKFNDFIDHIRNVCGDDVFDKDELKDVFEETFEFDYDDRDEEDIIDELLNLEIIEDTEEYFDLDEDGEIDHSLPKFDCQNYKDKYVEMMLENIDDFVEEYVSRFGYDGIEKYINFDDVAEQYVDIDGVGHFLSSYDSKEREVEIDGKTYYIYRRN